jgi:uncharacterized protein (DUF58 family)
MVLSQLLQPMQIFYQQWMQRRMPSAEKTLIDGRRILIFFTGEGLLFSALLLALLLGSVNYQLNLGYALTFLLASMGIVSIFHTYRNLRGLQLEINKIEAVFAGEMAYFEIAISSQHTHESICIQAADNTHKFFSVTAGEPTIVRVGILTTQRGWCTLDRFLLYTVFPFGLMRAWSWIDLKAACLVYPAPSPDFVWENASDVTQPVARAATTFLPEDFAGLRAYQWGDSFKQIAWKAYAEGRGLHSKQFSGVMSPEIWLEWQQVAHLSREDALSHLCRAVLEAEKANIAYGLRIPSVEIQPTHGVWHMHQCLRALALYGKSD